MKIRRFLLATCFCPALLHAAAAAPNLIHNPDFADPSALGGTTSTTGTMTQLGGAAAADRWTTWAGTAGGRVITTRSPTGDSAGGHMLDVLVMSGASGLVQAFLRPDTGPDHVYACVWIRLVSGAVGVGVGNAGDTHTTVVLDRPGSWQLLGTENGVAPANELVVYRTGDGDAEFQIREATVSEEPVACRMPLNGTRPETHFKPEPAPWTVHPERGSLGDPARGGNPSPNGYFENMRPGGERSHHDGQGNGSIPQQQPPAKQQ